MGGATTKHIKMCCGQAGTAEQRNAVGVVQQLSKTEFNRLFLVQNGFLKILARLVRKETKETTAKDAIMALFRIVQNDQSYRIKLARYGILPGLKSYLEPDKEYSSDLVHWALLLTHQFAITDGLQVQMLEAGFLQVIAPLTRLTFGNANMQKLCLHSLVRFLSYVDPADHQLTLESLRQFNILPLLVTAMRSDDAELASWSVFLIHEFVTRDVGRRQIQAVKGILATFSTLLSSEEPCIPRLILRSLKYLAMRNESYQLEMINAGIIRKTVPWLQVRDRSESDGCLWALALLHDLLAHTDAHSEFIKANGIGTLIEVPSSSTSELYVADILVYLAAGPRNREALEDCRIEQTVIHLYPLLSEYVVGTSFLPLSQIVVSNIRDIERSARDESYRTLLEQTTAHLMSFMILLESDLFDATEETSAKPVVSALVCIVKLWKNRGQSAPTLHDHSFQFAEDEVLGQGMRLLATMLNSRKVKSPLMLKLLLMERALLQAAVSMLSEPTLLEAALIFLSSCCRFDDLRDALFSHASTFKALQAVEATGSLRFYMTTLHETAFDFSRVKPEKQYVGFSAAVGTPSMKVSPQGTELYNACWTFESIRTESGVSGTGAFGYEIVIRTPGILQLGWTPCSSLWDPEAGTGVGDSIDSYAYDGHRCKAWNGQESQNNHYGETWEQGDIITAMIDLDKREISFSRNGNFLGVAFTGVSKEIVWYVPASQKE
ncbi:hypothetical protein HKX48_005431 [Thoreauomyces humboldtii]|nr:hypothetical protein HKX48_005431 [Thoreauomyces humboldtii]